jgi:hypothetical protein
MKEFYLDTSSRIAGVILAISEASIKILYRQRGVPARDIRRGGA